MFWKICKKKKKGYYAKINMNFCTSWYECSKINVKSIKKNKKSWKLIDQYLDDHEANFVSNDIMSVVSKSNKCKTC